MRVGGWMGVASFVLLLSAASATPVIGQGGVAIIETSAYQLSEHSNEGVKTAVLTAVETAARGAKAMGFTQITVKGVRVLPQNDGRAGRRHGFGDRRHAGRSGSGR